MIKRELRSFEVFLDQKFKLKDLGDLRYFLGLEIANRQGHFLVSKEYALEILEDVGLLG